MARKSTKRIKRKRMRRIFLVTLICLAVNSYVIYSVGSILNNVYDMQKQTKQLDKKLEELKEEEDILKSKVKKLKDPVYVAKYAREKFFYSGDNEYIIRMK